MTRYIIISPVKDEEWFIERTIQSVRKQTLRPLLWIIVDDGSTDRTPEILAHHTSECDWIRIVRLSSDRQREPGSGVIRAFLAGYNQIAHVEYDFVVKLDCDLEFEADYFERVFERFTYDSTLGIASGVYWEEHNQQWVLIKMPDYHAAGASKVIRRACFQDIGGFVASRGWDTVDEIRALAAGWKTTHFADLKLLHLKAEGSGIGFLRTSVMAGEIYYLTGGGLLFFSMKFFHRLIFGTPRLLGAIAMVVGYGRARLFRRPRLVSPAEARLYRALLNSRISAAVSRATVRLYPARKKLSSS